jgi:hypothetical protein
LKTRIALQASASLTGKTGVEMEAMTAVSVALLTVYDMAKAVDKAWKSGIRLIERRRQIGPVRARAGMTARPWPRRSNACWRRSRRCRLKPCRSRQLPGAGRNLWPRAHPARRRSLRDGWLCSARRGSARPVAVVGESAAGTMASPVQPGEAIRIATGAMMPQGADAMVLQED